MADEKPNLIQIDDDWKKQAQAEKRKLAEAAEQKQAERARQSAPPAGAAVPPAAAATGAADEDDEGTPFDQLVRSTLTQTMLYLGLIRPGGQNVTDYDTAKRQVDTLGVLKEKTTGNLTDDEKLTLDIALHEARSRYVSAVSQTII